MGLSSSAKAVTICFSGSSNGLVKNFVVQVPHEVNEASLLWASEGVVCGVEIRDHDAFEPCQ